MPSCSRPSTFRRAHFGDWSVKYVGTEAPIFRDRRKLSRNGYRSLTLLPPSIAPLAPTRVRTPFDHREWLFELKHDGFRALAYVDDARVQLVSRTGHVYRAFERLAAAIGASIPGCRAILDGELVCLGPDGRSQPYTLLRRREPPSLYVFDLLWLDGRDLRDQPLRRRKVLLEELVAGADGLLRAQHVIGRGVDLFCEVCARDCEGIVAKWAESPYRELGRSPWLRC